jgi:hypothetical protein
MAAALVAALAGCAPPPEPVSLAHGDRNYSARDFEAVQARWSRGANLMDTPDMEQKLRVDATFLSWDFRWAHAVRHAADMRLSAAEAGQGLQTALQAADREHEFFVALETQTVRWGELDRPSSAWRVRLIDDQGREVAPARIERVRRLSAGDHVAFPYVTPWRQLYRLHFPREATVGETPYEVLGPGTRFFLLRFAGPLGTVDLRWEVRQTVR